ncbi:hypothetical protein ACHAQH_001441 [Verticillium albo-atrum]
MQHLRGGVELSRNVDKAVPDNDDTYDDANHPGACTPISQIIRQIRRLDMQAVTFLVDWTPANIQDALMPQLVFSDSAFWSLDQAADHLQILVARVMRLCNTEQQMLHMDQMPSSPSSTKDLVRGQLEMWSSLFDDMLQQGSSYETDSGTSALVSLLRLQHTVSWILLNVSGPGREMDYDDCLPQFQQCVALANDVAAAHGRYSGPLKATFTPEVGIVPVLYIIGVKCRHPVVRREVVSILRRQPMREAVWDSISTAKLIEWVIGVEEGGCREGNMTQSMEQIPVWQRLEMTSWVHVSGKSAARMDITYTFCGRRETYLESLTIS